MKKLVTAAAALFFFATAGGPASAQATIEQTMDTCAAVIELQYNNNRSRDGQCIAAVGEYLDAIGAPSVAADPLIADLVVKLYELYQDDPECKIADTELPIAIATAAGRVEDEQAKLQYLAVAEQIETCDFEAPGAVGFDEQLNPDPEDGSLN
jgi:hypothetical protein